MFNQQQSPIAASLLPMINMRIQAELSEKYKSQDEVDVENLVSAELHAMLDPHRARLDAVIGNPDSTPLQRAMANKLLMRWSGLSKQELSAITATE